jgi:hypothetical protein
MTASTAIPFPDLQTAELRGAALESLLCDIEALGQQIEIVVKASDRCRAEAAPLTIAAAAARLRARDVLGVQVRYTFSGRRWCDTLLVVPGGVKLVRSQFPT